MADTKLKAGAVYRYVKDDGTVEEFLCWSTRSNEKHGVSGWIQQFGHAKQIVKEGTDICNKFEMVLPPEPVVKKPVAKKPVVKKAAPKKSPAKKTASKASE